MAAKSKRTKILYTVMTVILTLVILPLLIVVWKLVVINRDALRAKERDAQLQNIENVAKQVESFVELHQNQVAGIARTLESLGGYAALQARGDQALADSLQYLLKGDPNLIVAGLIPSTNGEKSDVKASWERERLADSELGTVVQEAVAGIKNAGGKGYVGPPRYIPSSSEFAIVVAEPVIVAGQEPAAMLAVVSMEDVFGFVKQNKGGAKDNANLLKSGNRVVFLVNSTGHILVHPDRALVYSATDVSSWEIVKQWLGYRGRSSGTLPFELTLAADKLAMLGSYTTARIGQNIDLGVIAVINEQAAYSSVGDMIEQAVTISIATVAVALVVGAGLALWLTSPIQTLADGARAIATGDFSKRIRVKTTSEIGQLAEDFNSMAEQVQRYINDLKFAANENRQLFLGTVRALAEAIDGKDPYTRGHSERVMQYSVAIAQSMGMKEDEVEDIRIAAILHDVGKIGIEDRILKKPAALTEEEYDVMKGHPQKGANIMSQIPQMKKYVPGMYYHHECVDGKGYPLGLKGDQIPMMARIISVADTFDAMTTNRPYQRAMETEVAVARIRTFSGTRYDPAVVAALEQSLRAGRLDEIIHGYQTVVAAGGV